MLTTQQAAEKLKLSRRRVLALISDGRLPAKRYGPAWLIDPKDLAAVKHRPTGRPPTKGKKRK